jgi:nucleoside-diphosphate-sugar epimerase
MGNSSRSISARSFDFAQDWTVSSARLRDELGYPELVSLDEGLRRSVAWERANPLAELPIPDEYAAEDAALAQS